MADVDRDQKTFDPTPARMRKAHEEGNLFRAPELIAVGMLGTAVAVLVPGAPLLFETLKDLMGGVFLQAASTPLTVRTVPVLLADLGLRVLLLMAPFFGVLMVAALTLNVVQSGWNVTFKPLMPKPDRIDPLKGLQRIFSTKGLFQLFKSLVKIALVGPIAYSQIKGHLPEILMLHTLPLDEILATASGWIVVLLLKMIGALLVLSGIDFAFEKWKYRSDLKMTHEEVKQEARDNEGNPQIKGRRRQLAREMARRPRLDHAVLKADVVVTNPTHYAVALRYDPSEGAAPRVVAKGIRKRALRIKELARAHDVPTVEDRPLARTLYATVEEGQEIPEDLYAAVAAILAAIYRQRK